MDSAMGTSMLNWRMMCLTKPTIRFIGVLTALLLFPAISHSQTIIERTDLQKTFQERNAVGSFAIYDPAKDELILVNSKRAQQRMIPASTFKIANALIALETGVVANENEVIPYGGKPQRFKSWERDMSIRDGIKISNVPVFQELATRISIVRYEDWLKRLHYGNGLVGSNVKTFWLDGPLKISVVEQVKFLTKLAQQKLPVSKRSQVRVADILKQETKAGRTLYGKTGWTSATTPELGWFVGWVDGENGIQAFALNMDIENRVDAKKRVAIAKAVLEKLGKF